MLARLVSTDASRVIRLVRPLTLIGRLPDCEVHLDSLRVSRRHCCLAFDADGVVVRDLGSTNGTWVNGHRIEEAILRPGDELAIAHLRFRLVFLGPAGASGGEATQLDGDESGTP